MASTRAAARAARRASRCSEPGCAGTASAEVALLIVVGGVILLNVGWRTPTGSPGATRRQAGGAARAGGRARPPARAPA